MLHLVQSALIDFYDGEDSFLSYSHDLIANWDPTTYSDDKSILPKKIITVIGKESSGTTFVAKTIAEALKLPGRQQKYRDGYFHQERRAYDELPTQVQHVSLPQGQWCLQNHSHHIVDVILPPHCVTGRTGEFPSESFPGIRQQCEALLNGTGSNNAMQLYEGMMQMHGPWFMKTKWKNKFYYKAVRYPGRTFAQSDLVRSKNVTIIQKKRHKMTKEELREKREEKLRHYHRERLLDNVFDSAESEPPERNSGEDPPPLVIQRGEGGGLPKNKNNNSDGQKLHPLPRGKRRLGEAQEDIPEKTDKDNKPIKFRFDGGEVKQIQEGEEEGNSAARKNKQQKNHHHPPRQRGFRRDTSNLTEEQKKELERRLRIVNAQEIPSEDGEEPANGMEEVREESQNDKIRRQNRERKREMIRREREARLNQMDPGNLMNDDEPTLHGRKPSRLSRQQRMKEWLSRVEKYPLDHLQNNNLLMYPGRFMLNITAQKMWYDARGTEQVIVIVVRDPEMSLQSRLNAHCHILELAKEEEAIANAILNDAIQTFFLDDKSGFQNGFGGRWYGKTVEEIKQEAFLWDHTRIIENRTSEGDSMYSSRIPANNNVVLVSYEAMMKYQQDYVLELYKVMGIESDHKPVFIDGNAKYRNESQAGSIGRRPTLREMPPATEQDVGFRFRWLIRQPERYQGILLAIACCSVFVGSFSLWVAIFWLFFRRTVHNKKKRKGSIKGKGRS